MPSHARKDIIRVGEVATYHSWSRCVQSAYLCGVDPRTGVDLSHRKVQLERLIEYQTVNFAVDLGSYHILSNHLHLNPCTRPDVAATWSDDEVALRWKRAWPHWESGEWYREVSDQEIEELLSKGVEHLAKLRENLSSLSWYMGRCKEPLARLANAESRTAGHFWAERFGSRLLEDDNELLVSLLYTDLQQVKCGAAKSLRESGHSSIEKRVRAWAAHESHEIVEAFRKKRLGDGEYHLSPDVVEKMLLDSWLTPFSGDSPILQLCRESQAKQKAPQSRIILPGNEAVQESKASPAPTPAPTNENTAKETKPSRKPQKTFRRLREFQEMLAKMDDWATRRPLFEMPRRQYMEIVRQAAEQWTPSSMPNDGLIDPANPPDMSPDGTISSWKTSVKEFRAFVHKAARTIPLLRAALARGDPATNSGSA